MALNQLCRPLLLAAILAPLLTAFTTPSTRKPARARRGYTPTPMDPTVLKEQFVIIGASGGAFAYWWTVTVPMKRREVAASKRTGEIADLLDDLETADAAAGAKPTAGDRRVERWLLSDWRDPKRRKDPAVPFLGRAKFNSGDNPILVAGALIMATGVANAIAERAFAGGS